MDNVSAFRPSHSICWYNYTASIGLYHAMVKFGLTNAEKYFLSGVGVY